MELRLIFPRLRTCYRQTISVALYFLIAGSVIAQQNDAVDQKLAHEVESDSETVQTINKPDNAAGQSDVEQRELGADEDPLAVSTVQRKAQREVESKGAPERTTGFDIYGSARIRYRKRGEKTEFQDGSSRLGVEADWQFVPDSYLMGRYELGLNVLKRIGELNDTIFDRLFYVGLAAPKYSLIVGKNWSPYYQVASFTDRFEGAGGVGSGTFNALTDGGPTGTGRADKAVQGKLSLEILPHRTYKQFDLNIQLQHGNAVPFGGGADYDTAVGLSTVITTHNNFSLGLAYNHASINLSKNPSLREIGITGSARALLIGARAFGERWYTGFTAARHKNHETTGEGIYFDSWGSEFYGQYRLVNRVWLVGGYNILEPDSDQAQAGEFRVKYSLLGLRYSFEDFRRMIWANVRVNDGLNADGSERSNVYTIGIRWDLSKRGWRMSN